MSAVHTGSLEDMIKQRIREERFDSVIPKRRDQMGVKKGNKDDFELSQEKSKEGLGDIYEKVKSINFISIDLLFFFCFFFSKIVKNSHNWI